MGNFINGCVILILMAAFAQTSAKLDATASRNIIMLQVPAGSVLTTRGPSLTVSSKTLIHSDKQRPRVVKRLLLFLSNLFASKDIQKSYFTACQQRCPHPDSIWVH
jgi:hypothetical protein